MAEQGIEQAAKAGYLSIYPNDTWEVATPLSRERWRAVARAMQPHLARESSGLTPERVQNIRDMIADAQAYMWTKKACLKGILHVLDSPQPVPLYSDIGEARPTTGNEHARCTTCGALLVCLSCGNHQAEALKRQGYVPASALGPVTDEEWLDLCAGGAGERIYRRDIDLFLKRRLAPEPVKPLTAEGFLAQHGYCDSRPHSATAIARLMEDYAELKAQKESANG